MIQLALRYNISIVVDIDRQYHFYFLQENWKGDVLRIIIIIIAIKNMFSMCNKLAAKWYNNYY